MFLITCIWDMQLQFDKLCNRKTEFLNKNAIRFSYFAIIFSCENFPKQK